MVATCCLLTCALIASQTATNPGIRVPTPQLANGQELVYSGTYTEEVLGDAVRFSQAYRLEARVLVLETKPAGADLALLTVLRPLGSGRLPAVGEPASVRLELARASQRGALVATSGASLPAPVDGPATVEGGAFVEAPNERLSDPSSWDVAEDRRPPRKWRVAGWEPVGGTPCVKLVGLQQSDDWDRPRADRVAWRRQDLVWLLPRLGVAARVERVVEHREPARRDAGQRSALSYTLESSLIYPAALFEDCRREILRARALAEAAEPYVTDPGKAGPRPLEATLAKLALYLEHQPPTPYRAAVLQVKRHLEMAIRGEAVPAPSVAGLSSPVAPSQPAPDFVVPDLVTGESTRLKRYLGKPAVLVFYRPESRSADDLLHFAQDLQDQQAGAVAVIGLAVAEDRQQVLKQREALRLTLPVLSGNGLRITYGVDATPKIVVLDAAGIVRGSYSGWGNETAGEVKHELDQCRNVKHSR